MNVSVCSVKRIYCMIVLVVRGVRAAAHARVLVGYCEWYIVCDGCSSAVFVAGKEMARLKSLNVMGHRSSMKGQSEVGCTPEGRRVACFGTGAEYGSQQSLTKMRSPQMQMQMLMSGSKAGSGYKQSYHPG